MAVLQDLVNETQRLLAPVQRAITFSLTSAYTAGGTSLALTDLSANSINSQSLLPGSLISVDLELMLITGPLSGGAITVSGGYLGSTAANHVAGVTVYLNRKFTDFECAAQINHVLDDLGGQGLYNLAALELSYNPIQQAYDLTDSVTGNPISGYIEGIAIRTKTPLPDRKYRTISSHRFEVLPQMQSDANFPSGYALFLNGDGWPGQPMLFFYKQSFSHMRYYTDNVQTVAMLPDTANDLPPMGAMLRMVPPREVARNQTGAQPDSRLAPEVPPGAIANSAVRVQATYMDRINSEKSRLKREIGQFRRRW